MTRLCVLTAALVCFGMHAQQQTGAPAGIAVPPPPAAAPGAVSGPQTSAVFRIRVVDGRNGEPMRNAHATLWYDEKAGAGYAVATDARGFANMPAPVGEPVRVLVLLVDATDCRRRSPDDLPTGFNLQDIAAHGTSAENHCGQVGERATPGELVLFARPPRWYEGINRGTGN